MFLWSIQSVLFGQFYLHIFVQSGMLLMKFLYTGGFYVECWFLRRTDKLRENKYKFCQEFNIFINSYKNVQGLQFGDDTKMHFSDCKQVWPAPLYSEIKYLHICKIFNQYYF